jgi:hypothetical protein
MLMSITAQESKRMASPESSADWIRRCVQEKTHGQVRNLTVVVRPGVVYLDGVCMRYYTKQLASQAALEACSSSKRGAELNVQNAIRVR